MYVRGYHLLLSGCVQLAVIVPSTSTPLQVSSVGSEIKAGNRLVVFD
jgi:hypothetical protein